VRSSGRRTDLESTGPHRLGGNSIPGLGSMGGLSQIASSRRRKNHSGIAEVYGPESGGGEAWSEDVRAKT